MMSINLPPVMLFDVLERMSLIQRPQRMQVFREVER